MHSGWSEDCGEVSKLFNSGGCGRKPYAYLHGGGGSHAEIHMRPVFQVRGKGVPGYIARAPLQVPLGYDATSVLTLKLKTEDWQAGILCGSRDGDEKWDSGPISVTASVRKGVGKGVLCFSGLGHP